MNSRSLSNLAIVGFIMLGAVLLGLRYRARREAEIARQDSLWELTYEIRFEATTTPSDPTSGISELRIATPFNTPHVQVLSEDWTNAGLTIERKELLQSGTKEVRLSTTRPGIYAPQADFTLRLSPRANARYGPRLENLSRDDRTFYLRADQKRDIPTNDDKVRKDVQTLSQAATTEWEKIEAAFNLCMEIVTDPEAAGGVKEALANKKHTPAVRARTMVTLCRAMGIPARLVTGFEISQTSNAVPRTWVEVFYNQRWVPFDTESGYRQTLPNDYVPVRRGDGPIVIPLEGTIAPDGGERFSIRVLPPNPLVSKGEAKHPFQIFNLERLPVPMHTVMSLLLLLPFGALITAVIRNVVGVQTFGTFAPALLAMSFIYADPETGLAIFLIVVTVGLVGRWWLERLRLLMVPRLSIILTLVILCVVFSVSTFDFMGLTPSAQAVLLPMVILTILIERFHVTVEEDGLMFALKLTVGTLVVAALCYLVLGWEEVGAWVLTYPEVHFFTIAAFILLGRYAGYRLTELWRFRDLIEPGEPVR
ncbi:MAG: hypothetical protein L0228_00605 [Planctomycetes bacterium]|nr:hypothetical protein [Planctomycetota bacterium]